MKRFYFTYPTERKDVIIPKTNGIILRIKQDSIATASISFIQDGQPVEVPKGITIKNKTNDEMVSLVFTSNNREFILGWTCTYEITLNGEEFVSLVNPKDWDPDLFLMPPEDRYWSIYVCQ